MQVLYIYKKMQWFKCIYTILFVLFHHCASKDLQLTFDNRHHFAYNDSYYEYVPGPLKWKEATWACHQKSGFLTTVATMQETRELSHFLQSLNITDSLWIGRKAMDHLNGVLEFSARTDQKHARIMQQFPNMQSVTVCAYIQFDPSCLGVSTVFSYSIQSFINEFQLRANIVHGEPIQLALLVHGIHSPYSVAGDNDGLWHFVCVSWTRDDGRWAISVDGSIIGSGDKLFLSDDIGRDGVFIIGQEQDTFGGSFKKEESFTGNITQLHMWDRVLNSSTIQSMARDCSVISEGLFFTWNFSALQLEPSVKIHWVFSQCQGNRSRTVGQMPFDWIDGGSISYHNFSLNVNYMPNTGECVTIDPVTGSWGLEICSKPKRALCQYDKDVYEHLQRFSLIPLTSFFFTVSREPLVSSVMDELQLNTTGIQRDLSRVNSLTGVMLKVLDENPDILTSADLLYLTQFMGTVVELGVVEMENVSEAFISLATNWFKLASKIIDTGLSAQWLELTEQVVIPGPFAVIKNIDSFAVLMADTLSMAGMSFTLSTKNIDLHIEPRTLSHLSCGCVFKPGTLGSHSGNQDEIQIPDTEVSRLHAMGYRELTFIHVYYSHLVDLQANLYQEPVLHQQKTDSSSQAGRLTTAVISSTVRDPSTRRDIPVAVHYTLSHAELVGYTQFPLAVCVFWDFSLKNGHQEGWSSEGCQVMRLGSQVTSCFCNHTTNFAVLMKFMEVKWSPEEESILTKLTFIGSGASLCALVMTLVLFTVLDIPKSDRTSIHKNLFLALIAAQVVLLSSGSATSNKVACTAVAALLHLFFMAAFTWMLVEGLLLWSKVVTVNLSEERRMKYYYLIGWGLPVLIVSITLAATSEKYSADGHCWLSVKNGVIWGFAGPVIFIIMVNILVLTRVVLITLSTAKRRAIMLALNSSPIEQAYDQIRAAVKAVLVLLPILGLTWLCGVLVPFSIVMAYIFVLLNSLQGLFIFLIYGVYNTEVRSTIDRIKERRRALNFSNCANSRPSSSLTSSRPASSPALGLQDLSHDLGLGSHCASEPDQQNIPNKPDSSMVYENSAATSDRQLSIPSLPQGPDEDLPCFALGSLTPEQGCQGDLALPNMLDSTEDGCSLHVPMDFDSYSCISESSAPHKRSAVYI
ncbi:UNVERIFIED_CONTAM: hypothetical protein FKN15_050664 [Acipenser sinensis]